MHQRLLVVCDPFVPPAFLPRVRYMCDYLSRKGWHIDILTEHSNGIPPLKYNIYSVRHIRSSRLAKAEWLLKSIIGLFFDQKNNSLYHWAKKHLTEKYDAILCSTFFSFPLPAAAKIAQKQQIPLIADLRDIPEQAPEFTYLEHRPKGKFGCMAMRLYTHIQLRRRNSALRQANAITTVSPWHVAFLKQFNPQTHLIYNGYDPSIFVPQREATECFRITYTGRVYEQPMQDPTLLFQSLEALIAEGKINKNNLELCWYTDETSKSRIQHYLTPATNAISRFLPLIPYNEIPTILNRSSLALVLSNRSEGNGNHGIMTTKFFEALGCECPVLCVRSDEECLAQTIHETAIGLAATNLEECKNYILKRYEEWKENNITRVAIDPTLKAQFSRQYQAERLEQILLSSIGKPN